MTTEVIVSRFHPLTSLHFLPLIPSRYRDLLMRPSSGDSVLCLTAESASVPVGAILAMPTQYALTARLLWLHVDPVFRRQGVGRILLQNLQQYLHDSGTETLETEYSSGIPHLSAFNLFLAANGWQAPKLISRVFQSSRDAIGQAEWLLNFSPGRHTSIGSFSGLSSDKIRHIRSHEWGYYPDHLSPFARPDYIVDLSLVVYERGALAGWLICVPTTSPQTVLVDSVYIHPNYQCRGLIVSLISESIRRGLSSEIGYKRILFNIHTTSAQMMRFAEKRLAPYMDCISDVMRSEKLLRSVEASDSAEFSFGDPDLNRETINQDIKDLYMLNPRRALAAVMRQWLLIGVVFWAAVRTHLPLLYAVAFITIATRQNALAVLMHDAAHFRLTHNRRLNSLLGDFFCAFPLGFVTSLYRHTHFQHHRYTHTARDPDWTTTINDSEWPWPKSQWACLAALLKPLLFLDLWRNILMLTFGAWSPWPTLLKQRRAYADATREECGLFAIFLMLLLTLLTMLHLWLPFTILWIAPLLTLSAAIARFRGLSEHPLQEFSTETASSRHVEATLLERLLIAPLNSNCHLAHHLFPGVPFYNLPALHKRLLQDPYFAKNACSTKSYFGRHDGVLASLIGE